MRGYVWRGGFTIYRVTPWANGLRAMGTGRFEAMGPLTRINFQVGLGRSTAYGLAFLALFFGAGAVAAIAAILARGSVNFAVLLAFFPIVLTLAFALSAGRMPRSDGQRSEEADRLLTFLRDVIGAEPSRTT